MSDLPYDSESWESFYSNTLLEYCKARGGSTIFLYEPICIANDRSIVEVLDEMTAAGKARIIPDNSGGSKR